MTEQRDGESWRDYIEREIRHLEEKIDLRFAAIQKALELQAIEYERRMEILNHEGARISKAALLSVSREKYDADREADRGELDLVKSEMLRAAGVEIGKAKAAASRLSWIALLLALASLFLGWLG